MKWKHTVDLKWLAARQYCLSATDIKELLPVTASGRKRKVDEANFYKVVSRKLTSLTHDDAVSYGAAARGHILEPYAIDMYNANSPDDEQYEFHHWDDKIIKKLPTKYKTISLGFSPDACNIPMPHLDSAWTTPGALPDLKAIAEVKSYSPEKHMVCGHGSKAELEERWQIAAAMAVADGIEEARLILFNPSMTHEKMFVHRYTRSDLEDEIKIVEDIEEQYIDFLGNRYDHSAIYDPKFSEDRIVKEIVEREKLLPEDLKSIVQ